MWQAGRNRTVTGVSLGALTMLVATGCSFNFSAGDPGAVDSEEIATQAAAVLEEEVGQAPDDLTCSEDLPAQVDASIRCELTGDGHTYGVTVTTTSVEGDEVNFDVVVDEEPMDRSPRNR